jgi:hypothetical protein
MRPWCSYASSSLVRPAPDDPDASAAPQRERGSERAYFRDRKTNRLRPRSETPSRHTAPARRFVTVRLGTSWAEITDLDQRFASFEHRAYLGPNS